MNNEHCDKCGVSYDSDYQSCGCQSAPVDPLVMPWVMFHDFDALPGDVVIRRWVSRETGRFRYSLIECWKSKDDYLPGTDFLLIDDGRSSDTGLRAMDYWSR